MSSRKFYLRLKFTMFWALSFALMFSFQSLAQDIVLLGRLENGQKFVRSPIGDVLAVADTGGNIFLWDSSLQEIVHYLDGTPIGARLESLRWSPDGHFLVGGFSDVGRLWDTDTGELLHEFDIHPIRIIDESIGDYANGVTDITFSPDGSIIATAQQYDSSVALWNAQTYELLQTLDNHEVNNSPIRIDRVEFSSDGITLAANSYLNTTLWNVQTGQRLQVMGGNIIAFSPDGTKLATGFGRLTSYIETWDITTGERLNTFEAPLVISGLQWTANSKTLIGNFTETLW
jgi:WD40 repeat protein